MKVVPVSLCVLAVLFASAAVGQVIYNSSSTAAEGYQRGMAAVIDAQGQRNLSNSQAAINMEDAYSAAIDNSIKSVNAFWEKKDIYETHQQEKFAEIGRRRDAYIESRGSLDLSYEEFDRTTGHINWPTILQQSQYDPYRETLDEVFAKRSYEGAISGDDYTAATRALKDWRAAITAQKGQYPDNIVQQMLRFQIKVKRELDDNLG